MKKSNAILIALGSLLLVGLFQNCSGVNFAPEDLSSLDSGKRDLDTLDSAPVDDSNNHSDDDDHGDDHEERDAIGLPHSGEDLDHILSSNKACSQVFSGIDPAIFPQRDQMHLHGNMGDIKVANVSELFIAGNAKSIAAKNIGLTTITGVHGSLCLQSEEVDHISGVSVSPSDIAIIGPSDKLGQGGRIVGVQNSDLVLVNYHFDQISGKGRSLHVFGGRIEKLTGIFTEIHLYNGATIGGITGKNQGIITH